MPSPDVAALTRARTAAVGDSLTVGLSKLPNRRLGHSYAHYLHLVSDGRLQVPIGWNLAVGGRRSDQIRAEQVAAAIALAPPRVIVLCGANDVLQVVEPSVFRGHLDGIVADLRAGGVPEVVVCTIPPVEPGKPELGNVDRVAAYNAEVAACASAAGVRLADVWAAVADPATGRWLPGLTYDDVHFLQYGAGVAAERVVADLAGQEGALGPAPWWMVREPHPLSLLTPGAVAMVDVDQDGVADALVGASAPGRVSSLVPGDASTPGGRQRQEVTLSGTTIAFATSLVAVVPGHRLLVGGYLRTEHAGGPGSSPSVFCRPAATLSFDEGREEVTLADVGKDVDGWWYLEVPVPEGARTARLRMISSAGGTAAVELGAPFVRDLTAEEAVDPMVNPALAVVNGRGAVLTRYGPDLTVVGSALTVGVGAWPGSPALVVPGGGRDEAVVALPAAALPSPVTGGLLLKALVPAASGAAAFGLGAGGALGDALTVATDGPSGTIRALFRSRDDVATVLDLGVAAPGAWHTLYVAWDGAAVEGSIDAGARSTGERSTPAGVWDGPALLGAEATTNNPWSSSIGPLLTLLRPLTEAEVALAHAAATPWDLALLQAALALGGAVAADRGSLAWRGVVGRLPAGEDLVLVEAGSPAGPSHVALGVDAAGFPVLTTAFAGRPPSRLVGAEPIAAGAEAALVGRWDGATASVGRPARAARSDARGWAPGSADHEGLRAPLRDGDLTLEALAADRPLTPAEEAFLADPASSWARLPVVGSDG